VDLHEPITLDEARLAADRVRDVAIRTPLVRLQVEGRTEIHLKLENLQPIGSFKIRGAANRLLGLDPAQLESGVWTASAGNMAQGAAWCARLLGVPFTAVVPDSAPEAKLSAIRRLGGAIQTVSREEFFEIFSTRRKDGLDGVFVHAFSDRDVMAGNATIGLELVQDLPSVAAVYVPYGGGGLSCGIASAVKQLVPEVQVIACEPATAAPLAASMAAGSMQRPAFVPSFVDGAGGPYVYPEMFELAQQLIDRAVAISLDETAAVVRLLADRAHVVAEGAGALSVAAALHHTGPGPVVCIVSGGNINMSWLATILEGATPAV
jgi:threonine dehydratase